VQYFWNWSFIIIVFGICILSQSKEWDCSVMCCVITVDLDTDELPFLRCSLIPVVSSFGQHMHCNLHLILYTTWFFTNKPLGSLWTLIILLKLLSLLYPVIYFVIYLSTVNATRSEISFIYRRTIICLLFVLSFRLLLFLSKPLICFLLL